MRSNALRKSKLTSQIGTWNSKLYEITLSATISASSIRTPGVKPNWSSDWCDKRIGDILWYTIRAKSLYKIGRMAIGRQFETSFKSQLFGSVMKIDWCHSASNSPQSMQRLKWRRISEWSLALPILIISITIPCSSSHLRFAIFCKALCNSSKSNRGISLIKWLGRY